jgi:tetratricopeptide (TPR) repeat protein
MLLTTGRLLKFHRGSHARAIHAGTIQASLGVRRQVGSVMMSSGRARTEMDRPTRRRQSMQVSLLVVRPLIDAQMATRKTERRTGHDREELALRRQLKADPRHHWLLTRLSSVYYEQRRYAFALKYAEKAFVEAPSCPLVLWDYAGALQMLERHHEALDLYARIVNRGANRIGSGECGEGTAWARGLVSDSHYRASLSLKAVGRDRASVSAFDQCLDLRGPGCRSIYRLTELNAPNVVATRPHRPVQPTSRAKRRAGSKSRSRATRS